MPLPLRRLVRAIAPEGLRRAVARARRSMDDARSGLARDIVAAPPQDARVLPGAAHLRVRQAIMQTAHAEGKIANLRLAAARVTGVAVPPQRVFSFWALAGAPSAANGYGVGRSIVADRLTAEVGGGLCQLSGLVYELALRGGLAVVERHPHSRDLYTEETRFTPLGLDATVVWGFKDLRVRNTLGQPVAFDVEVGDGWIEARLHAPAPVAEHALDIERVDLPDGRRCASVTRRVPGGAAQLVSRTDYVVDGA